MILVGTQRRILGSVLIWIPAGMNERTTEHGTEQNGGDTMETKFEFEIGGCCQPG